MLIHLGLGSNEGDRRENLRAGIHALERMSVRVLRESPVVESPALLPAGSPTSWNRPFLNAVIECDVDLEPRDLRARIREIEHEIGGEKGSRWSPRAIDIDLLIWGNSPIDEPDLKVPYPELEKRAFVISPLSHLQPDLKLPGGDPRTVLDLSGELSHHIPLWMGILNITPDSFSDGGKFTQWDAIEPHLEEMIEHGAHIIDIGAESTRPSGTRFNFERFSRDDGLGSNKINQLLFDEQQRLWYAGENGIGYLQNDGTWLHFDDESVLPDAPVIALTIDENGYLWGGTAGGGLFRARLHSGYISVQLYTTDQGLSSNYINQIHFDKNGQLWLGHPKGVDRLTLNFYDVITNVQTFGVTEGFTGIETTPHTVWENNREQLFFGTKNGLMRYTPGSDKSNEIPPPIRLEQVRLFYEPLDSTDFAYWSRPYIGLGKGLVLPHHQNHVSFEFDAVNLVAPEKVRYQFQLIGADPQWSPETDQKQATYTNLKPGDYRFQVKSINEDGKLQSNP